MAQPLETPQSTENISLEQLIAEAEREFKPEIESGLKDIANKVELSVHQALKQAWAFNLQLRMQHDSTQNAQNARRAFYLQFIPDVSLSASLGPSTSIVPYIKSGDVVTRSEEWSASVTYSVGLSASVTLFDMKIYARLSRLSNSYQQALITEEILYKTVAISVIKKIYAALKAQKQLVSSKLNYTIKQKYFNFAQTDYNAGRISRLDYLVSQSELQSSEVDLLEKEFAAKSAQRTQNLLLGYVPQQELEVAAQLNRDTTWLDEALPAFDAKMPELRQKQLSLRNAQRELRESYLDLLPQFSLTGSLSFNPIRSSLYESNGDISTTLGATSLSSSINLTWNLTNLLPLSSGQRSIRAKRQNLQYAQDSYREALRQKRLEYIDQLQSLLKAKKSLQLYKTRLAVSKERLKEAELSYNRGLISYEQFLTARQELENLETSTDDLIFDIMETLLQLGGQLNLQYL